MILTRKFAVALSLLAIHCGGDGDNGYVDIDNEYSLLLDGEDDFGSAGRVEVSLGEIIPRYSVSLWFKQDGTPEDNATMLQFNPLLEPSVNTMQMTVSWQSADQVAVHLTPDFAAEPGVRLFADLTEPSEWNHIVLTFDADANSNNVILYLNGEEVDSGDLATALVAFGNIQFGRGGSGLNYFKGYLDEAAIWESTLSSDEVMSVYAEGIPRDIRVNYRSYVSSDTLASLWRMGDENRQGDANVSDFIGGNNCTLVNGGTFELDTP
jgi:hypothetical protein